MTDTPTAGPLEPYLHDDERLRHLLTNSRVGVERGDDGARAVRPGDSSGAYLGLTDQRIVVLVVDPVDRNADFVTSHRYTNVADVTVESETLTTRVEFETVYGETYSFTTRESDVEAVATFLSVSCEGSGGPSTDHDELEEHCEALSAYLANGEWEAFDNRVPAAMEAVESRRGDSAGPQLADAGAVATDLHCLVRDRYVLAGREKVVSARRRLEAGELEQSYRDARTAYERFERAREQATQEALATANAIVGLTKADDIADTSLGRLFATGRHRFARATDGSSEARIDDLEAALDIYETVGTLVTGSDVASEQARERAREEAGNAIEALVEARLASAREARQAADWEQTVDNEAVARKMAESARADLDRALELATAYPPGDADAIRERCSQLVSEFGLEER
ncbi:PH domain-containing protein [Haloarcula salinisoli]|uniref:PH domain-containing protein n=1 Tax=Haloarcula salinisoli TaxID=2487746 RepID=A0A8J7YPB4_9EURY|nr:PH domain-containing protein [Halomicroarcula salinisoli]MBX0287611.1 PH domain-containing protein [Halomicroarcula salinisoli]MBX0304823.1 PH domain-containing protein [Halomicroarcula salinisoli]